MVTEIRVKELNLALPPQEILSAHFARLAVLYEDLRIEVMACAQDSIPALDTTDERYRRNYFLKALNCNVERIR